MGLLASIFGNGNTVKNRKKNRNFRVCRIEEMEPRVMLSANNPFVEPVWDDIELGVVFHDWTCHNNGQPQDDNLLNPDTFSISWNGGVENDTRLAVIEINLAGAGNDYYEDSIESFFLPETFSCDIDIHWEFSSDGKKLTITLPSDFDGKELKFTVSVIHESVTTGKRFPVVTAEMFAGATVTATFVSTDYHEHSVDGTFAGGYGELKGVDPHGECQGNGEESGGCNGTTSAHAVVNCDEIPALKTGSLSGFVYEDKDSNGKYDDGEGIEGVKVSLYQWVWNEDTESGEWVQFGEPQYTDVNGAYFFDNVDAFHKYKIQVEDHDGYECWATEIGTLGGKEKDLDTIGRISMTPDKHGEDYNFIKYKEGLIDGYVYVDEYPNGWFDNGESGIEGVILELWEWSDEAEGYVPVMLEGESGDPIPYTATTDNRGYYSFTGLKPGKYKVVIVEGTHEGYECWVVNEGSDYNAHRRYDGELDAVEGIVILSGTAVKDYNFGKVESELEPEPELPVPPPHECPPPCDCPGDEPGCGCPPPDEPNCGCPGDEPDCGCTPPGEPVCDCPPHDEPGCGCPGDEPGCGCTPPGEPVCDCPTDEPECGCTPTDPPVAPPADPPTPPPTTPPTVPVAPPSSFTPASPTGGAGAFVSPNVGGWYAPSISEPMRSGFGSGTAAATALSAAAFSWNLSVINAGYPRANGADDGITVGEHASRTTMILSEGGESSGESNNGARYVSVAWTPLPTKQSGWYVRGKDGIVRKRFTFGPDGGVPVVGDFSGDGIAKIAVYHEGNWYIDINGNGVWDEEDLWAEMGTAADQPVAGDWDGDGKTDIGTFGPMRSGDAQIIAAKSGLPTDLNATVSAKPKNVPPDVSINVAMNSVRAMKHSQAGGVRLDVIDHVFQYGNEGDKGFTGDFTGDGIATIGVYRDGKWFIDRTGTGKWDENAILVNNADFGLGAEGIPVIGDFNGDGIDKIGLYVNGTWYLDTTGDFHFDTRIEFGEAGDYPVVGDFDGTGIAQLAVYRASVNENPLMANIAPEPAMGTGAGMVAGQYGEEPDQEALKHHGRSLSTPHTNAPLLRGR